MTFGERLRKFAEEKFGTITKLAAELGMGQPQVQRYVSGDNLPKADFLEKLAKLGCNINWLLTGDIANRTYVPLHEVEGNRIPLTKEYKIVGTVPAGYADVQEYDWYETAPLEFDPANHVFVAVDEEFGYSMMPTVNPGDLVLISFSNNIKHGDLVAARWDDTKGALKIYVENPDIPDMAVLTSYNQSVEPIFVKKSKVHLYKVVLIKKRK